MKKVLVLLIGLFCACAAAVHAKSDWSSEGFAPRAQMGSTSSALISMQAHERLNQSCLTSYSVNHTSVQDVYNPSSGSTGPRKVGPNKPNEPPGAPLGDGLAVLLLLALVYYVWKRKNILSMFISFK